MDHIPSLNFAEAGWCEDLGRSYPSGLYRPKTATEFHALKQYATSPPDWDGSDNPEKDLLVDKALALLVINEQTGKPVSESVAARWGVDVLQSAVEAKEAEDPDRAALVEKALELKIGSGKALAKLDNAALAGKIAEVEGK